MEQSTLLSSNKSLQRAALKGKENKNFKVMIEGKIIIKLQKHLVIFKNAIIYESLFLPKVMKLGYSFSVVPSMIKDNSKKGPVPISKVIFSLFT